MNVVGVAALSRHQEYQASQRDQCQADRDHASVAARARLFEHHDQCHHRHPGQVGDTRGESDQHQSPAATEAEEPVVTAQGERSGRAAAAVMGEQERAWVAASLQARVLQRRELKDAGADEYAGRYQPAVRCEPWPRVDSAVDDRVTGQGQSAKHRPHHEITGEKGSANPPGVRLGGRYSAEQADHGQARGQHHRRDHRLPRDEEEAEGGPGVEAALDERVVVELLSMPGGLRYHRQCPGHSDGREDQRVWQPGAGTKSGDHPLNSIL